MTLNRTSRGLLVAAALATTIALLSSCTPVGTWEALAVGTDGRPIVRTTCKIHYLINVRTYTDNAKSTVGYDITNLIRQRAATMGPLTGVYWVFDGFTTMRSGDGAAGAYYTRNTGVIIELTTSGPIYSQPLPARGPVYKGGTMTLPVNGMAPQWPSIAAMSNVIDHELGHQYGLGDLYDGKGGPDDLTQKMGRNEMPWGSGDKAGFAAMTERSRATCAAGGA